ncbi:MAG TPA: hypothetical protein VIW24_19565 [Aldersonia sp.]
MVDTRIDPATRRALHGVAELLVAGPQYRAHGTIRLAVDAGGFAGTVLRVGVRGAELVWPGGHAALNGRTCAELGALASVDPGVPEGLYRDTSGVGLDEPLTVDVDTATRYLEWFSLGDKALRLFAPEQTPVLWPEHFDLGIIVGAANYGVSLGDDEIAEPYAYIGPHTPQTGPFWNASFGAARTAADLPTVEAVAAFFAEGRDRGEA